MMCETFKSQVWGFSLFLGNLYLFYIFLYSSSLAQKKKSLNTVMFTDLFQFCLCKKIHIDLQMQRLPAAMIGTEPRTCWASAVCY